MVEPRDAYLDYVDYKSEEEELDSLLSYEEWLEDEVEYMWEEYECPYQFWFTGAEHEESSDENP